jgi:hypothetical protein
VAPVKSICVVGVTAALLLNAAPSALHQASVGSLQDAYKAVCQWSVDAFADRPTSRQPGAEARWDIRVRSLREKVEDKSVQIGRLPVVAKDIEVDRKDEGTGRRATYTVSAASGPAFAALGMKLLNSGGWVMRSDTYAQLENQVCMLRLTLTDASGRLASLAKNATIEGLARIDKASFGSYGVTFQMALTDWAVSPPR